jgi:hypothetical protein
MFPLKPKVKHISEREKELAAQVLDYLPFFFNMGKVLYIGANRDQFLFHALFQDSSRTFQERTVHYLTVPPRVDVLEIHPERAMEIRKDHGYWLSKVIIGDVTDINNISGLNRSYDMIFWAYGPSVVPRDKVWQTLYNLEMTGGIVVIMVPWGNYSYPDGVEVHPLDKNVTEFRPIDFIQRGYAVHCLGEKDTRRSNLLAWKNIGRQEGGFI